MHEFDKCILAAKTGASLAQGYVRTFEGSVVKVCLEAESPLAENSEITLYIFNRVKGECVYNARIAETNGKEIGLDKAEFVRATQKRDNTRVSKTLHYTVYDRYIEEGSTETEKLQKPFDITILNISATGLFMTCSETFTIGQRFPLVFLETGSAIKLQVQIIRADRRLRGNSYGCHFLDVSGKDADNIYRFVLHEQIVQRRRRLII